MGGASNFKGLYKGGFKVKVRIGLGSGLGSWDDWG